MDDFFGIIYMFFLTLPEQMVLHKSERRDKLVIVLKWQIYRIVRYILMNETTQCMQEAH